MRFCKISVCIITVLFAIPSGYARGANVAIAFKDAKALMLKGDRKGAVGLLRNAGSKEANRKATLLAEQFVTADNFQRFQDVKSYAESELWSDCIRSASQISLPDQDNLSVLRTKAMCQLRNGLQGEAAKTLQEILVLEPVEPSALMGLAKISASKKQYEDALRILEPLTKTADLSSADTERLAILRSEIFDDMGQTEEAVRALVVDHEKHLDHIEVIFRIARFYQNKPGFEWQSRRNYALFVSRYKRLSSNHGEKRRLAALYTEAQNQLTSLDKKLAVDAAAENTETN